jgi:hypothetical protein
MDHVYEELRNDDNEESRELEPACERIHDMYASVFGAKRCAAVANQVQPDMVAGKRNSPGVENEYRNVNEPFLVSNKVQSDVSNRNDGNATESQS